MNGIISFLEGIGNAIILVFEFIVSFFRDLIYVIRITGEFLLQIPTYLNWLPTYIVTPFIALFGIVVIYKILGRTD